MSEVKKFEIEVEALTPVIVRSPETLTSLDYYVKGSKLYVVKDKLVELIPSQNLEKFNSKIMEIADTPGGEIPSLNKILEELGVEAEYIEDNSEYKVKVLEPIDEFKTIYTIIRNPLTKNPYVPGSTIKGLIRNAILLKKTKNKIGGKREEIARLLNRGKITRDTIGRLVEEYINTEYEKWAKKKKHGYWISGKNADRKIEIDPFRIIQIADSEEIEKEKAAVCVARIYSTRKIRKAATECINKGTKWRHTLTINEKYAEKQKIATTIPTNPEEIKEQIIESLKTFAEEAIELEEKIIEKAKQEAQTTEIKEGYIIAEKTIEEIKKQIQNLAPNQTITKIGWGAGILWKTQLWLLAKQTENPIKTYTDMAKQIRIAKKIKQIFPITQKTAQQKTIGWIKITIK